MARHTFGTMTLSAGIPIESIAKMMGHASISSTQVYAQVTDSKISEDMDRLIDKYKAKDKNTTNVNMEAATDTKTIPLVVKSNGRKEETV
ncbi:site-specific recombinase XerD [Alloprevotella rava]|uniref:Site-specific recombinase XerD n=2 Tax=Prevotellaceae TaxID=171552 RepID=A0A7W5UKB6_9BACT|nr:site-specific recombinase XerD [Alloprevotella rava]